jgi:hypothetical protein
VVLHSDYNPFLKRINKMDINQTKTIIKSFPKRSIMLHAKHGVGKSSVVKQAAKELNIPCIDVRLSQCEVGDIKGLPHIKQEENGEKTVHFAKPEWYPRDPNSAGILFFDELNRASKEVLQAVFEICLDRRLDGLDLPDKWIIVSAVNSDDDYDVVELDPALQDRFFHIDFEPSVKDWLSWANRSGIHKAITQFVSKNENLLDPPVSNLESGRVYPSRRSWEAFNEFINTLDLMNNNDEMLVLCAKGWLGREIAIMFQKYVSSEFSILDAKDVLDDFEKNKKDIELSCSDIEIISSLAKAVVEESDKRSANKFGDIQRENLYSFFMMLPNDVASDTWVGILNSGQKVKKMAIEWQSKPEFAKRLSEIYLS